MIICVTYYHFISFVVQINKNTKNTYLIFLTFEKKYETHYINKKIF